MDNKSIVIKSYKKDFEYSYTLGAFPTIEMIKSKPEYVKAVYVHSTFKERAMLSQLCDNNGIPLIESDKIVERLSDKANVFVVGTFNKYYCSIADDRSHIVLVNPSDMGNLGTIIRTAVGFGIKDIALIRPGADIFHPKVIRSSMGSLFRLRHEYFNSFKEYRERYCRHEVFTFMLNAKKQLMADDVEKPELFSLVFGNEAAGLDDSYLKVGTSLLIPQSSEVDSLNLTIAVGIGMFLFTR